MFLQELDEPSSGKELLEVEVLWTMRKEGFSDTQIYEMPIEKLLDLFYSACLWRAHRILSKATIDTFLKRMKRRLI
jgi:hypothetical protein